MVRLAYLLMQDGVWVAFDAKTHRRLVGDLTWDGCGRLVEGMGYKFCKEKA